MDNRKTKTKRGISNAFIQLRASKSLEKITIKELCEIAEIGKATFYLHYKDIYDLSEQMQNDLVQKILAAIHTPELVLSDPAQFTSVLFNAFSSYRNLIDILFSGSQKAILPSRIERGLKEYIFKLQPNKKDDIRFNILLTYKIMGGYYAFDENRSEFGEERVLEVLEETEKLLYAL